MEYTHEEYCVMFLILGTCNSRAGATAREYALRYPGRRHPDNNVFRQLEQRLHKTGSVTPTALENAGRPRTVRTPANEDVIIAPMEQQPWRSSRDITSSKYFMMIYCIHTTTRVAHICFQTIVLCGCNFAKGYINTLRMSSFYTNFCEQMKRVLRMRVCSTSTKPTSEHGIILMLSANVGIKSASPSALGLVSSGSLSWAPI
jgi:hypothetical protein